MTFLNYVQKYKMLVFHPTEFFKSVQAETKYWPILLFVAIPVSVTYAINILISIPYFRSIWGDTAPAFVIFQIIGFTIMIFLMPFVSSAITHIGVKIVHGKNDFFNTFKPVTYTGGLMVIYQIIGGIISFIMTRYLQLDGLEMQRMILEQRSFFNSPFLLYMIFGLVINIIQFVHFTFVEVIGVSYFQNISKMKALMAALVIPLVLMFGITIALFLAVVIIGFIVGLLFNI